MSIVPSQPSRSGDGCFIEFGEGTFSVGFLHPQIECVVPGVYRGDPLSPSSGSMGFWRLHNGPSDDDQVVQRNNGNFPIYVRIEGASFFSSSFTWWTRLEGV